MNKLVIITWVSWSWKTTLQDEMLNRGWKRPINFTTREPRWEHELDEYVFLTEEQFFFKMKEWDFLEHTNYNWTWYWVGKHLPEWNVCIVLDPVWRSQVLEKVAREWLKYEVETIYIDISEDIQELRLKNRWDLEDQIERRKSDFKWFAPTSKCKVVDWLIHPSILADNIENGI